MGNYTPEQVAQRVNAIQDAISAGRMTAPMVFTKMREIIATTLRQQAGRVDEVTGAQAHVRRLGLADCRQGSRAIGHDGPENDRWEDYIEVPLERLAALAQNTQGEEAALVADPNDGGFPPAQGPTACDVRNRRIGWMLESTEGKGWWSGRQIWDFTTDPNNAAVFSEDAARFQERFFQGSAKATEHVWIYLHAERARVPEADVIGDAIEVVMEVRQFMESAKRFDAMKRMQKLAIDLEQLLAAAPSQRAEVK